jgi:hypothetical protein
MTPTHEQSIACTLQGGSYTDRLAGIAEVARDGLRRSERRDLTLELTYAPHVADRVRDMVAKEQDCCAFLTFDVDDTSDAIRVTISAPERAREVADFLFEQFVPTSMQETKAACCATSRTCGLDSLPDRDPMNRAISTDGRTGLPDVRHERTARVAAVTTAAGAVACGVCCVLPFALPTAIVASTGSLFAWIAGAHFWATALAALIVGGAWISIAVQSRRRGAKPSPKTIYAMMLATAGLALAYGWPRIEAHIVAALKAAA